VKDATSHADEDRKRRELVDARNQADALAHQVEKTLGEQRGALSAPDAQRIEAAVREVREAVAGEDLARITRASEQLQHAAHAMAETLYRRQSSNGGAQGGGPGANADVREGEVVDAE
jgi:molecular chaperone DnaK